MDPLSPTEVAQLLKISPGPHGKASTVAEEVVMEAVQRLHFSVGSPHSVSEHSQEVYAETFCSQYLPSYIRTLITSGETPGIFYIQIFDWFLSESTPSIARFVREQPREACQLYLYIANQLAVQAEIIHMFMESESGIQGFIKSTSSFITLHVLIAHQLPPSVNIPHLPARSTAGVVALASVFKSDPRMSRAWGADGCALAIEMLSGLAAASDMTKYREGLVERTDASAPTVWWSCELGRISTAPSECVKMEDGEQMMACSRCIAVRYCSREHQRADWKRHKLVCFKPSW